MTKEEAAQNASGRLPKPAPDALEEWQKQNGSLETNIPEGSIEIVNRLEAKSGNTMCTLKSDGDPDGAPHLEMDGTLSRVHFGNPDWVFLINDKGEPAQEGDKFTVNPDWRGNRTKRKWNQAN